MLSTNITPSSFLPYSSKQREPRAIVTVNGTPVLWEDITVQTTTFFMADNYTVVLPLHHQNFIFDLHYWSAVTDLVVKIYIGFPLNPAAYTIDDLELFMAGAVDMMDVDPLSGRVTLSGRDLSSRLIDTKISQIYANDTASNIAIKLAEKHNLNPNVVPTQGNVGKFFKNITTNAQNLIAKQTTEWDLITFLAQQSGYVVFLQAEDLFFVPFPTESKNAYLINYQPPLFSGGSPNFFGTDLHFRRSLTLANDVVVHVIVPTNPQTGKSFTKTAQYVRRPRGIKNIPNPTGVKQSYNFVMAGLTPEQAQQQANRLAQNITLHEIVVSATLPGDNILRKDSLIQVQGTNTAYDQLYYTDTVTRRLNMSVGYEMQVVCKNHSTDSQIQL